MKLIENIQDLKKGDTIIVKDNSFFVELGHSKVQAEVFALNLQEEFLSLKCRETNTIEKITIHDGKLYLL